MKPYTIQQEVLLSTTTSFSQRQWCEKDVKDKDREPYSPLEALEKACWDGLLDDLLPEIMSRTVSGHKLFLWHLQHGDKFLFLELGEQPPQSERALSINPYLFLRDLNYN